jgi:hypothetical protein
MKPYLVTPPTQDLLDLQQIKDHLRVTHDDEDAIISGYAQSVMAEIDGWDGVCGRAIMPQVWAQDFEGPGPHRLALPDVGEIDVTFDGAAVDASKITRTETASGTEIELTGYGVGVARIQYACALSERKLPLARTAALLMIGHLYDNRAAVITGTVATELPLGVDRHLARLRWVFL